MKYPKIEKFNNLTSVPMYDGESIETKVDRIVNNNEPITDGAPIIFTEKKDGVRPEFDVRTDRWDIAIEAMDKVNKSKIAKSEVKIEPSVDKKIDDKMNPSPSEN